MQFSFFSLVIERPQLGNIERNLVAFADTAGVLDVLPSLVKASDIVQSRFRGAAFLIEMSESVSLSQVQAVDDAFEISLQSNLFCLPMRERLRLPHADYAIADFQTYTRVFDVLKGEEDVDIDGLWEKLYDREGLIFFRLVLGQN